MNYKFELELMKPKIEKLKEKGYSVFSNSFEPSSTFLSLKKSYIMVPFESLSKTYLYSKATLSPRRPIWYK